MKYLKTFENFKPNPLSDDDILEVFSKLEDDLKILGITIELKQQEYGMPDEETHEKKYRVNFEMKADISKIENSILHILLSKIVKEPFNYAVVPYDSDMYISIINEFPSIHSEHLKESEFYINPQTKEKLYNTFLQKIISYYESKDRIDKLKVLTLRLASSATNNIYTNTSIKETIISYLINLINGKGIPESILKEISDGIKPKTVFFIKNNKPFNLIYNELEKYLNNDDIKKSYNLGEMGFDD